MPPKPITRIQVEAEAAKPESEAVASAQARRSVVDERIEEMNRLRAIEEAKTPEQRQLEEQEKERRRRQSRRNDRRRWATHYRDDKRGLFNYGEIVVISSPIKDNSCSSEKYRNMRGRINAKNGCKCLHTVSENCYHVFIYGANEREHFEECELSKV